MNEKYLTLEQNICPARIFLNIFGLVLEDSVEVNEASKLKIFDKDKNVVGELYFDIGKLYFDNSKVILSANYNNAYLEASYDIARTLNAEYQPSSRLCSSYEINFNLSRQNEPKISGGLLMWCSADVKYGFYCFCRPLIKCAIPDIGDVTLTMAQNEAFTYSYHFVDKLTQETVKRGELLSIDITKGDIRTSFQIYPYPFETLGVYFYYRMTKGGYNKDFDDDIYLYEKSGRIYDGASSGKENILIVNSYWRGCSSIMPFEKGLTTSISDLNIFKDKMATYMLEIYPYVYTRIREVRDALIIGDISLFDNLVSVCCDNYTDEELRALLGVNRQKMNYQNGADSLVNSYFEIGRKSTFFAIEEQQKLVRKNK